MNCRECHDWLHRWLDGDMLAPAPLVERHLAECPACRIQHASAQVLLKGLSAAPAPALPMNLSQRLTALVLEDRRVRRRRLRLRLAVTTALAAAILVMALAGPFLPPLPPSTSPGPGHLANENKGISVPVQKADASPRFEKSVEGVRQAFASLSEQWLERAKEQAQGLLA